MKLKFKTISLDWDGVLNDMITPYLLWLNDKGLNVRIEQFDSYCYPRNYLPDWACDFWKDWNLYSVCELYDGALEFLDELKSRNLSINIVTSTPHEVYHEKDNRLKNLIGDYIDNRYHVNNAWHKHKYTQGSIFVDDYYIPILGHSFLNHEPCILFNMDGSYPWINHNDMKDVLNNLKNYCISYKEILETIDFINGE